MAVFPDFDRFRELYEAGTPQVMWTEIVADLETPISAYLKLTNGAANSFLLESVEGGAVRGRYSIIGLRPDLIWRYRNSRAEINRRALEDPKNPEFFSDAGETLSSLRALLAESLIDLPPHLPPMAAGLVGYLGYDTVRLMEPIDEPKPDVLDTPDGIFIRPTVMAIFDSVKDIITAVTPVRPDKAVSAEAAYDAANQRLTETLEALAKPLPATATGKVADIAPLPEPVSNTKKDDFLSMVERAKQYIAAGDIFQVVLSQRFSLPFDLPPVALYRALRRTNPSPFLYFLSFDDVAVVGSSPEILVRVRDGKITIRPIAGTRPRGATAEEDKALEAELLADPKELAEHLMLLDLGRNDVGRVAKPGTLRVTDRMIIERYSHVMHIVSNVEAEIDPKYDMIDAFAAGFPAGTVSGAPKIRAMEIIDEMEPEKRGIYAGGVGYFSANGSMDTCIVLRTAVIKDNRIYVQAGAGVVYDSDPEKEYEETRAKARAVIRAAEEAVRFANQQSRNG